ncbi:TPA: restriction endonuclease subunit S [Vibrio vulnificus]|nr:restriction endonuclease subunit S [Vibrio vulnificus]HAS8612835.1 restriction endonuclease subunit S [Vibrio vulnificus]
MKIDTLRVEDICDFIGGSQPAKSEFIDEPKTGYVRLIQTRDYKTDSFPTYIPENSTRKFCDENDIMIGRYGPPVFQICRGLKGAYNVALLKAKPKAGVDREFLYYFLKQDSVFQYVDKLSARTGGQTGVDLVSLNKYPVRIPNDTTDQRGLVASLVAIDKKIELNNRINSELEAMAKTLYDYWFVQFDFPDENGKPYKASGGRMVFDSELNREIPMGWTTKSLGEIVNIVKGNVSPKEVSSSTPYIGLEHIQRKNLALIDWASSDIAASNKTIFKEGDILFGKIRPYFHKVTVAPFDGITSTDTLVFRPKSHKLYGLVLEVIFSGEFVEIASQSSTGSKMPRADWNVLKNYPVVIPQDDLLEKFQGLIDKYCKKLKSITIENHELRNLRDWLLPMLMNGQVTVKPSTESKEAQHG